LPQLGGEYPIAGIRNLCGNPFVGLADADVRFAPVTGCPSKY
jgi:hypothetical protein